MKGLNKITLLIIVILIAFSLISTTQINKTSGSTNSIAYPNSKKPAKVAILLPNLEDLYLIKFKQSLENIQQANSNTVNFTFFDGKNNPAIQSEIIDSMIRSDFDLLLIDLSNPTEDKVKNVISQVKQKNIPLLLFDVAPSIIPNLSKGYDKVTFISPDFKQPSIAEGEIITNLWNTNKSIIDKNNDNILQYIMLQGNNEQAITRTQTALSVINNSGIKTEQLQLVNADWNKDIAKTSMKSLFLKYGDKIEAIIANNDSMALGAIEALQEYGYNTGNNSKYIPVFGMDGLPESLDLIDKGLMAGTVILDPNPFAQGIYTIVMNFINNVNPIENTNYTYANDQILIPLIGNKYINKTNT